MENDEKVHHQKKNYPVLKTLVPDPDQVSPSSIGISLNGVNPNQGSLNEGGPGPQGSLNGGGQGAQEQANNDTLPCCRCL